MIADLFAPIGTRIFAGVAAAAIAIAAFQTVRIEGLPLISGGLIAKLEKTGAAKIKAEKAAKAQFDAHVQTIRNYRQAQSDAAAAEAKRIARVATTHERINDEASADFDRRARDLRARYERLLAQGNAAGAAGSSTGGLAVPGTVAAAGRAAAAPAGQGLPLDLALTASLQAEQLDALITAIERQAAIDPNAD